MTVGIGFPCLISHVKLRMLDTGHLYANKWIKERLQTTSGCARERNNLKYGKAMTISS